MVEDLVVIAAHGGKYIKQCVESLGDKYPILVVGDPDTHIELMRELDKLGFFNPPNTFEAGSRRVYAKAPFSGYTTGKYLWAYWNYSAKNFLFMQDSMEALEEDYLEPFKKIFPIKGGRPKGAVSWAYFEHPAFDNEIQRQWAHYLYGGWPGKGIFGPIFYTNRDTLNELRDKQLLPPTPMNKEQAQGSERLWAMAFSDAEMKVPSVGGLFSSIRMTKGDFPVFKKIWADRK